VTSAGQGAPRALFVLGVPRSGTTLIGNYLGSAPGALNLAEYGGFYVAHSVVPAVIERIPGFHHADYLAEIREHARAFAERVAAGQQCSWYVDHTPWNLEVAGRLATDPGDALFVLMLRHYAGNILSLRRFPWGGDSWADTARLWATLCGRAIDLPQDRLVVVGYDALTAEPGPTLAALTADLGSRGFPAAGLDQRLLAVSHATGLAAACVRSAASTPSGGAATSTPRSGRSSGTCTTSCCAAIPAATAARRGPARCGSTTTRPGSSVTNCPGGDIAVHAGCPGVRLLHLPS